MEISVQAVDTLRAAAMIRDAVQRTCADDANRTRDLGGSVSCGEMGDRIAGAIERQ